MLALTAHVARMQHITGVKYRRVADTIAHGVRVQRIMGVKYSFPSSLHLSRECVDLITKIFVANPANRISIGGIRAHPWFLKNLPEELQARAPASLAMLNPSVRSPGMRHACSMHAADVACVRVLKTV